MLRDQPIENQRRIRVVIIGAGFSGIYAAIRLSQRIENIEFVLYEKNPAFGGTWYDNRYPGCACDVPSTSYQYSFEPNKTWSSLYAPAKEICDYLERVGRKYSVDRFTKFKHEVESCTWNFATKKWKIEVRDCSQGNAFQDDADVLIAARGSLNNPAWPEIEGLHDFGGKLVHSARWDDSFDYSNKRIGVIGSGSSSIQIVPNLQKLHGTQISTFVRSKTWISPSFGDSSMAKINRNDVHFTPEDRKKFEETPDEYHTMRKIIEIEGNSIHGVSFHGSTMSEQGRAMFIERMQSRLSKKPEIGSWLIPSFAPGCRRLTPGPGYLEALTEDNVDFITTSIRRITPTGILLDDDRQIDLDVLVCATGFQIAQGPPFPIRGMDGQLLNDRYKPHPESYLSLAIDGFPNFFTMLGPNSAIGTGSLTMMIESMGDYVVKCVRKMQKENIASMAVKRARVRDFSRYIDAYFPRTVFLDECRSWYRSEGGKGSRIIGVWPGSTLHAIEAMRSPRWEDYEYEYDGAEHEGGDGEVNALSWLGNGWSVLQQQEGRDVAYYLEPEIMDVPAAPFPEESRIYRLQPFSH